MAGVVFHINEDSLEKQRGALSNLANLRADMPDVAVEVVALGKGIGFVLAEGPLAEEVAGLVPAGVRVAACRNTLKAMDIDDIGLIPGVTIVPAGVAEIVRRQQEGYSYYKP